MVLLFDGLVNRLLNGVSGGGPSVGSSSDECALCVMAFEAAVDRLSHIAEVLDDLVRSSTAALAAIEAHGDTIDRLRADNCAMLAELLNGT
jgi:hypothetical protein